MNNSALFEAFLWTFGFWFAVACASLFYMLWDTRRRNRERM